MTLARKVLYGYITLHALGSAFCLAGFLFFPEVAVDLVPDRVPLADVRPMLALFGVLPATFVIWDVLFLFGLRAGLRQSLAIGFVAGSAGVLGAAIQVAFGRWTFAAADGTMGLGYLAITWWNLAAWPPALQGGPEGRSRAKVSVHATRNLAAPSEAVWRVLGDFGTEHLWASRLAKCERDTPDVRVGTTRVCTLPKPVMGRMEARETLVEFEPGRALAYVLQGPAGPFASAESRWSTRADAAGRTEITVEGRFVPKNALVRILVWPLARFYVRRLIRSSLVEFEAFVAGGRPTPAM